VSLHGLEIVRAVHAGVGTVAVLEFRGVEFVRVVFAEVGPHVDRYRVGGGWVFARGPVFPVVVSVVSFGVKPALVAGHYFFREGGGVDDILGCGCGVFEGAGCVD